MSLNSVSSLTVHGGALICLLTTLLTTTEGGYYKVRPPHPPPLPPPGSGTLYYGPSPPSSASVSSSSSSSSSKRHIHPPYPPPEPYYPHSHDYYTHRYPSSHSRRSHHSSGSSGHKLSSSSSHRYHHHSRYPPPSSSIYSNPWKSSSYSSVSPYKSHYHQRDTHYHHHPSLSSSSSAYNSPSSLSSAYNSLSSGYSHQPASSYLSSSSIGGSYYNSLPTSSAYNHQGSAYNSLSTAYNPHQQPLSTYNSPLHHHGNADLSYGNPLVSIGSYDERGAIRTIPAPNLSPEHLLGNLQPHQHGLQHQQVQHEKTPLHSTRQDLNAILNHGALVQSNPHLAHSSSGYKVKEETGSVPGVPSYFAPDPSPDLPSLGLPPSLDPLSRPTNGQVPLDLYLQEQALKNSHNQQLHHQHQQATSGGGVDDENNKLTAQELFNLLNYSPDSKGVGSVLAPQATLHTGGLQLGLASHELAAAGTGASHQGSTGQYLHSQPQFQTFNYEENTKQGAHGSDSFPQASMTIELSKKSDDIQQRQQNFDSQQQQFDIQQQRFDSQKQQFDSGKQQQHNFDNQQQHFDNQQQEFDNQQQHFDTQQQHFDSQGQQQHLLSSQTHNQNQFDGQQKHFDIQQQQFDSQQHHFDSQQQQQQHFDSEQEGSDHQESYVKFEDNEIPSQQHQTTLSQGKQPEGRKYSIKDVPQNNNNRVIYSTTDSATNSILTTVGSQFTVSMPNYNNNLITSTTSVPLTNQQQINNFQTLVNTPFSTTKNPNENVQLHKSIQIYETHNDNNSDDLIKQEIKNMKEYGDDYTDEEKIVKEMAIGQKIYENEYHNTETDTTVGYGTRIRPKRF